MDNLNEQMAELASNLWNNYFSQKTKEQMSDTVTFYRATVTKIEDGNYYVKRPFDNEHKVSSVTNLSDIKVGDNVLVLAFGKENADSRIIWAKGNGKGGGGGTATAVFG